MQKDDVIYRQETIDAMQHAFDKETILNSFVRKVAIDTLKVMPSAQSAQKKGKWIPLICTSDGKHHEWCGHQCSICGERTLRLMQHNFCPNCGADMRET